MCLCIIRDQWSFIALFDKHFSASCHRCIHRQIMVCNGLSGLGNHLRVFWWPQWMFGKKSSGLTRMLLVANMDNTKSFKKSEKWLQSWHIASESTQRKLSSEYQHDRVLRLFHLFWMYALFLSNLLRHYGSSRIYFFKLWYIITQTSGKSYMTLFNHRLIKLSSNFGY